MFIRYQWLKAVPNPVKVLHGLSGRTFGSFTIDERIRISKTGANLAVQANIPQVIADPYNKYVVGKVYNGFQCERVEHIPDFELTSCTLRHIGTGTEFWYIDRKDANNVFSINFRTTPMDSTGLPHILEHLTLCGSKNFPVRDPFFKMLNRSVATFMNAMTGPDYTLYPFSTMNEVDFRNLQKIYLDAVFRPNLSYIDFLQEGWRLEHKELRNAKSELIIKGVVYNEMKGVFSDNSQVFSQNLLNNMLPDHTYGYVSGGNPLEIPKLTHKDLVDFHQKYYHPSNARIFCYGSFDLMKTLEFVDKEYLSKNDCVDNSYSRIPKQKRWSKPRNVHIPSRLDTMGATFDKQNQIAIGLLMCDATDIQENFELYVLSEILISGPNSAFYKSLIEPNFSGGYNRSTGYSTECKDTFFALGLKDLKVEDFKKFNELFDRTVHETIELGFEDKHVESVLHNLELSLKHQKAHFGKHLLFNSTCLWNHDGDIVSNLRVSDMISQLRYKLKEDKNYFQKKVDKYFANNPHKLTLTMSPDEMYEDNFKRAEAEMISHKINGLNELMLKEIYENGITLETTQKAEANTEVLPCLSLNDVQYPPKLYNIESTIIQEVPTQLCKVPTNEITYLKCLFNITGLSQDEIMLIPLFCNVITDMGTKNHNFREFDKLILSKTAGINFKLNFVENIKDARSYKIGLMLTTHALDKNVDDMFALCEELLLNFTMEDAERLKMLIENYISNISVGVTSSGHLYAMLSSAAMVSDAAKLKSLLSGIDHIEFMKKYVQQCSTEAICDKLKSIGRKVFSKSNMRIAINSSEAFQETAIEHCKSFVNNLPKHEKMKNDIELSLLEPNFQHHVMNIPVNYCAKAFFAVPYLHKDHPVLRVLAMLVSSKYLLPVVREQNGAYGAGAKIGSDGIFSFFSYRDPHSTQTLSVFDKTYEWLQTESNKLDQKTLFEAKLGVLQQLDSPIAPANVGIDDFIYGVSQEMFVKYRSHVLSVSVGELQTVIDKYFKEEPKHCGKCILGPASDKLENES